MLFFSLNLSSIELVAGFRGSVVSRHHYTFRISTGHEAEIVSVVLRRLCAA